MRVGAEALPRDRLLDPVRPPKELLPWSVVRRSTVVRVELRMLPDPLRVPNERLSLLGVLVTLRLGASLTVRVEVLARPPNDWLPLLPCTPTLLRTG